MHPEGEREEQEGRTNIKRRDTTQEHQSTNLG